MEDTFIVAEVSKNWEAGQSNTTLLLGQRFELVINTNLERGYKLVDWKPSVFIYNGVVNETIIAIFEKIKPG